MKTPKSRKRALVGWALAGTLGLAGPAAAQVSPYTPGRVTAGVARAESSKPQPEVPGLRSAGPRPPNGEPVAEVQARVEAIQIELAWLADPVTFPYPLTVHLAGPSLEVRGQVPSEAVRAHALRLARAQTARPVTDGLQVSPVGAVRPATEAPEVVQKNAAELLIQALGERSRGLTVQATPDGRVILGGTVSSYEEKLTAGRRLRGLRGCTGVVNELTVVTVLRDGKLYHLVTADGQCRVPAHPDILHVNHATPQTAAASANPGGTRPSGKTPKPPAPLVLTSFENAPELPRPADKPAKPTVETPSPGPRVIMVKMRQTMPGSLIPVEREVPILLSGTDRMQATRPLFGEEAAMVQAALAQQPAAMAVTSPAPRPETTAAPRSTPAAATAPAPAKPPVVTPVPNPAENKVSRPIEKPVPAATKPTAPASPPAPAAPYVKGVVTIPDEPPAARSNPPTPPAAPSRTAPPAPPAGRSETVARKPAPKPPAAARKETTAPVVQTSAVAAAPTRTEPPARTPSMPRESAAAKGPYVTTGVVTFFEPEPTRPAAAPNPPSAPHVSRGVVTFEEEPPLADPPAAGKINPAQLRSRIEAVCEGATRGVDVIIKSENSLGIRIKILRSTDAPRLSEKILNLPELAPYDVSLEVEVAP
ncbi:MAG TPA: BON domain-containing protein [Gemmataceae bacterium]|nr:BON domain-containing protein [Gemmataceae bacterium]